MTITMIVELSCDHDRCDVAYAPAFTELTSVQATRTGSVLAGWTRHDGRDYCPSHSATVESPEVAEVRRLAGRRQTDGHIALALGMTRAQVQALRTRHGIPAGAKPGRPVGSRTVNRREVPL